MSFAEIADSFFRPAVQDLVPYEPGKPIEEVQRELGLERVVKLASNEGPYGPFPEALEALRRELAPKVREELAAAGSDIERSGLTSWSFGDLPREHAIRRGAHVVTGFPGLVDRGTSVDIRVFATAAERDAAHRRGVRRLLLLETPSPNKHVQRSLDNAAKLTLARNPHGSVPALLDDCLAAAVDAIRDDAVSDRAGGDDHPVRTREDFEWALSAVRTHTTAKVVQVVGLVEPILAKHLALTNRLAELDRSSSPAIRPMLADVRAQLRELVRPGFVADTGLRRLPDLDRYLRAIAHRLDKAPANLARDAQALEQVDLVEGRYADLLDSLRPAQRGAVDVVDVGWMIEELRVSLFAQTVGTAYSVSPQRILKAIAKVGA